MPLLLIPITISVVAAGSPVQVDWYPNNYKVVCKPPDSCQLGASEHSSLENNLSLAVSDYKKTKFRAPTAWGERVGAGTDNDIIEVVESGANNVAYVSSTDWCNHPMSGWATMNAGNKIGYFLEKNVEYWVFNSVAHEVFHLIQYTYPFWDLSLCGKVPGWIMEGMATAEATDKMRQRFPSVDPSNNASEARQIAGTRRYDIPLPHRIGTGNQEVFSGIPIYQFTSSFWQHLASAHHKGKFDYLASYMENTAKNGDWVAWLRNNVELDTGGHLGMVFAGFLADYAGWGDRGYTGEVIGRHGWLQEIFGGCETVYLDKNNASGTVDVDLRPLAGECIEVAVSTLGEGGLDEGETAAVQIAAVVQKEAPLLRYGMESKSSTGRDGLHLSLVASTDKKKFSCAREVKRHGKKGVGRCVFVPDDGKIRLDDGEKDARVWNVIAQEKDDSTELRQQQAQGRGSLTNLYTVSYTPVSVGSADTRDGGVGAMTVRFYFVLDVANLQVTDSASGGKKRVAASLSPARSSDPQTTLPKQDARGMPANSFILPENLRPQSPSAPNGSGQVATGKMSTIMVSSVSPDSGADVAGEVALVLTPLEQKDNKYVPRPLSIGETGNFPMSAHGNLGGDVLVGVGVGSLDVEEFTDLILRARYQATLCRVDELKSKRDCPNPIPVIGQVVKAFAGTRLPGYHMRIEDTAGMKMYRKANEQAMQQWSFEPSGTTTSPEAGDTTSGTSSSSGSDLDGCTCSCEEREATSQRGEALKAQHEAGEDVEVSAIMGLARCSSTCQREYMVCETEKNEKEEAAAKASQASNAPADCDCSCASLDAIERLGADFEANMAAGKTLPSMDLIVNMGQCMAICQNEFVLCRIGQ